MSNEGRPEVWIPLTPGETDTGRRLDQFVHEQLPQFSRSRIQDWIRKGRVKVNGRPEKASYIVRGGEAVEVLPAPLPSLRATPEEIPLRILYEDTDLVAVDKPADLVVHAGAGRHSGTLVNALLHHFGTLSQVGGEARPGIVHRLDRGTSGVLLAAKTDAAHQSLARQFEAREVEKTYIALVHGCLKLDAGRIEKRITRDPFRRVRMAASATEGRSAWSEYKVIRRFKRFTLLEVRIGTGRTHQIRVHLSSIGHPVVGDRVYGAPAQVEGKPALDRFLLHARRISFRHPTTGDRMTVESPLPSEFDNWMADLS